MTAQQKAILKSRQLAAAWIAQQVSRPASVACDPVMCTAIERSGFPESDLTVLRSSPPVKSDLVVDTPAVSAQFGTILRTYYAPKIIAAFGEGASRIEIRLIAKGGVSAFNRALASDITASKYLVGQLLPMQGNGAIAVTYSARKQLEAGDVDIRAVYALIKLATKHPVDVLGFGNVAPGADSGIQLRYIDLAENYPAADMSAAAYLQWLRTALKNFTYPVRWANTVKVSGGIGEYRIDFGAPTPPGLS